MAEQTVLHVRSGTAEDDGSRLFWPETDVTVTTAATRAEALSALDDSEFDAVVCEHDLNRDHTGLDVLEAIRQTDAALPVLLCTETPDGSVAAAATRLGVTEYVPRSETDPAARLRERYVGVGDDPPDPASAEGRASSAALQRLTRLATRDDLSERATLERVIEIGCERLGMANGYLSVVDGERFEIRESIGPHPMMEQGTEAAVSNTYCQRTIERNETLAILDAPREGWTGDPAYEESGISCYLGGPVHVRGELYGTLCFVSEDPRTRPFTDDERTFVELLVEWAGREIERRRRERELERYENIIEAVDDGVYALDDEGHFEFVNSAMTELTGYDEAALLGSHTRVIKTDEVVERAESVLRDILRDEHENEASFDLSLQRADGDAFPAEDHMTLLYDDGEFVGSAGVIRDITERKAQERELRAANRRVEQILERIGDAFFAVDDDWAFTYINSRAAELFDVDPDAVEGENLWDVFPELVGSPLYDRYHEAMAAQEQVTFEEYGESSERWLRISAYPSPNGLSVYAQDVTEQKERDQALSGLLDTTRQLMRAQTPEQVAEAVVDAAKEQLGFGISLVRLYDEETDALVPTSLTCETDTTMPERPVYDADEGYPGAAFQRGETIRRDDLDDDYSRGPVQSAMYVPLGEYGVLVIGSTEPDAFDDADVSIAEILASNAAAAFGRVEREQDLRRYESVVENVRDMVYVLDADGQFQLVTEPLAEWLGFDRTELLGNRPSTILDDRSVASFERCIKDLVTADGRASAKIETTLLTGDVERPAEIEVSLIDDEQFRGTVGVVRDLTELKRTREQLRDERDRFTYLFDNLPDAVVETEYTDDGPVVRSVNPAFGDVFGYDESTVVGESIADRILPPDEASQEQAKRLDALAEAGEPTQAEVRRRTADGFRDFLFRGVPFRQGDDSVRGFGIYTDITEQRARERRLEVLNRVLRHNLRNDLTVVLGLADELETRTDDPARLSLLSRLQAKASDVASLSDRAREIERSVRRDDAVAESVVVPTVAENLASAYRDQYGVDIETSVPDADVYAADGRFRRVLGELLENAVEHGSTGGRPRADDAAETDEPAVGDGPGDTAEGDVAGPQSRTADDALEDGGEAPTISVDVSADAKTVSVTVADDGPGIPAHERDVVTGEEPITQLNHGSGLGLWLVSWVVDSYGGTVTFGDDTDGASVTLRLPRTDV